MRIVKSTTHEYSYFTKFNDESQNPVELTENPDIFSKLITQFNNDKKNRLKLSIVIDEKGYKRIKASHFVGTVNYKLTDNRLLQLSVLPKKIYKTNFIQLWNYAYGLDIKISNEETEPFQTPDELQLLFVSYYLQKLKGFLKKHFARNFIRENEVLNSKVKGKIIVGSYLSQFYAKNKPQQIPCEYFYLTANTVENRLIKESLLVIRRALRNLDSTNSMVKDCKNKLTQLQVFFNDVDAIRYYPGIFNKIRYVGRIKPYKEIHRITELMLRSYQADIYDSSKNIKFVEFALDMNDLFEKFVAGVIKKVASTFVYQKKLGFTIGKNKKNGVIIPDIVVDEKFIFDAKYKALYEEVDEQDSTYLEKKREQTQETENAVDEQDSTYLEDIKVKVDNSDIFQMVAYLSHQKNEGNESFNDGAAFLVYPKEIEPIRQINNFGKNIYITGIGINSNNTIREEVEKFRSDIKNWINGSQNYRVS